MRVGFLPPEQNGVVSRLLVPSEPFNDEQRRLLSTTIETYEIYNLREYFFKGNHGEASKIACVLLAREG